MPVNQRKFSFRISDFGGGVNLKMDDDEMPLNQARKKENWRNSTAGALEKVPGCARLTGRVDTASKTGTGTLTMTSGGTNSAHETLDIKVEIDGVGTPNTFKWSQDGGATWEATGVVITGEEQTLDYGIKITFSATTGGDMGDYWTFKAYQGIADAKVLGLFRYYSGATKKLLAVCDGKLWVHDGTEWTQVTGGTGLSTSELVSFLNYKGKAYFTDKEKGLRYYDGSKMESGGTVEDPVADDGNTGTLLLETGGKNTASELDYVIEIDGAESPNTFKWSDDGGDTWDAEGVAITGEAQTLNNGITITFSATSGGVSGDKWTFSVHKGGPDEKCALIKSNNRDRCIAGCGNATETARKWFCALEDFEDWSSVDNAGYHDVGGRKSGKNTLFEPYGNAVIDFKERGAWRLWNFPDTQDEHMLGAPGGVAPFSVAQGDGLMFHFTQEGVYMFDGTKFSLISEPIESIIKAIAQQYYKDIVGVYKDHAYWMFFNEGGSGVGYNMVCWRFDVLMGGWERIPDRFVSCVSHWTGLGDSGELYAGSSKADGVVWRLDYSSDGSNDGANITARYKTKNHHCDLPNVTKGFDRIFVEVLGVTGTLTVYWEIDKGRKSGSFTILLTSEGVKLDEFLLDTDKLLAEPPFAIYEKVFPLDAIGRVINFELYHSDTGESPVINAIEVEGRGIYK